MHFLSTILFYLALTLKRYGELVGAGSTFVEVSGKQMAVMELMMPPTMREQQTIGGFFQQLDHLITLHQRKCALLFSPFQAFISMMFTTSTFSWEQRKLTEFVEFFSGLTYTPNDVQENGTLVLRSSNVSNGEVVDADNVYVNPQVVNSENVKVGDIVVVVRNGSRSLIGKHAQIKAFMPNTVIGAFMTGIRSECPEFTNALLNTSRFEEEIAMNMGATINQITGYMFSKMEFKVPCLDEQKKIGEYFEKLDRLVTLHQRKCIFFTGRAGRLISTVNKKRITSSWEQRKLGDVVKEITRNDPESEAPIMMITANNGFIEQSERYAFNNAGESLKKYILLKKGELAYNHGASKLRPYGSCFALTTAENARIPFAYHCFSAENQNAEFMSIELNGAEIENQLRKIVSSGARMDGLLNISFDEYTSVSVLLPGTEEQDRIADFFRHLDNLITLHQRKPFLMKWRTSDANRNQTNRLVL